MRWLLTLAVLCCVSPATAGYDSAYTDFDLKTCREIAPGAAEGEGDFSPTYECDGFQNWSVSFIEDDLRSLVAFGKDSEKHCAFHQTFSGFNSVGNKIEWRLKDQKPIATIFRWSVSYDPEDSTKQKSWLVVTKLADNNSCHMGYVEGAYPKANEKARWLADTAAEVFDCKVGQPIFFANPGTVTDGIVSSAACD
jgi:hypothetical protein